MMKLKTISACLVLVSCGLIAQQAQANNVVRLWYARMN